MSQRDQLSTSENIQAVPPGATGFAGNTFNITLTNLGGVTTTLTRIYIQNVSPTGTLPLQCRGAGLCTVDPGTGTTNCAGNGNCGFTGANIRPGENNHVMKVTGLTVNDGSGYQVIMSSTRGRQFSFFYPWPVNGFGGSNSNATNTAHGALDVKFDINSFNFTRGTQTVSVPGWTVPYGTPLVYWVKVVNNALNPITISQYTSLYFVCYQDRFGSGQSLCNETDLNFVVDNQTMNPNTLVAYDDVVRLGLQSSSSVRSVLARNVEILRLTRTLTLRHPTWYSWGSSTRSMGRLSARQFRSSQFELVQHIHRARETILAGHDEWLTIVPSREAVGNSVALLLELFEMFGLNFQVSMERIEIGSTGERKKE
jgi:hypothetical protein